MNALEQLERQANAAREALAEAEAASARARAAAEERRQTAWLRHDEKVTAGYDAAQHDAEVAAAEEALTAAVVADPLHAAAIDLYAARLRRHYAWRTAQSAAGRLGRTDDTGRWVDGPIEPGHPRPVTAEEVDAIVASEAARRTAADQEVVEQQRVDLGERAARGR